MNKQIIVDTIKEHITELFPNGEESHKGGLVTIYTKTYNAVSYTFYLREDAIGITRWRHTNNIPVPKETWDFGIEDPEFLDFIEKIHDECNSYKT